MGRGPDLPVASLPSDSIEGQIGTRPSLPKAQILEDISALLDIVLLDSDSSEGRVHVCVFGVVGLLHLPC